MAQESLKTYYEKAKNAIKNIGVVQMNNQKIEKQLEENHPATFAPVKQRYTSLKHVAPVEHLVVHVETKKIYVFCQSGRTSSLRQLFKMIKGIDADLQAEAPATPVYDMIQLKEMRRVILQ
jgi:hypothetical protein